MALTPTDIHNKTFNTKFRGYDEDEVNGFLEQLMKDYENVLKKNEELEKTVSDNEVKITHFNLIEETMQKSILIAQEAAEDVRKNAIQESKLIISEAEKNADRLVNDALAQARKIALEVEVLKKQSKVFKSRFKMMVEAQLDMINTEDWDDLLKYELDTSSVESAAEQELDIPNVDSLDEELVTKTKEA
ncbi:cell-division initiation protein [Sporosarcina sp. P21c]|uniref:DivIVA domain-containing protein n=1 Tax=Sporosarcina TaxID=1569 RepID=UPI000A146749|nr:MULTISPECIES: DivIVA domain-containing protein [Sporosarcina]ARJ39973.1 cell-division initiation protein [Sporosarcina ureae]PIC68834.1 cell-division initiation protein [Sporosarcina sp. P16a]PIC90048.1 cell-division initiation protein [Sporosarcina sp. P21c]PIC92159.1 cell-division initiation protein [Sporosarcina sp. P25]